MPAADLQEQLVKYLTDAHSIEEQALAQLKTAPKIAEDPELERILREHVAETERHERLVTERLEAHGAKPSKVKDVVMGVGGLGFVLFAKLNPDTPGKLAAHAYSYEHLELASYELLARVAERAGDQATAEVARRIRDEERAMGERLAGVFDRAVEASLRDVPRADLDEQLVKYLADAHALEAQAIQLLERGPDIVGDPELARLFEEHLAESREHQRLVTERLEAHGGVALAAQGRGAAAGRHQLGHVLRSPARHAGQADRLRLRLRAPRDRRVRAAQARGAARGGRRHGRGRGADPRRGARRRREARRALRPRGRGVAGGAGRDGVAVRARMYAPVGA